MIRFSGPSKAERSQLLDRSFGMQPVQRTADVVSLLDGLPGAERERVVTLFSAPPLVVSLHGAPLVADAAAGSDRCRMFAAGLRSALGNLVDNAALYGGSATLRVEDTPGCLTLEALDNGPGLPPAKLERVFEPFFRLDASRNRATVVTGLGIARSIARLHGGDVVLHNIPLGGLAAVLSLPRRSGDQDSASQAG